MLHALISETSFHWASLNFWPKFTVDLILNLFLHSLFIHVAYRLKAAEAIRPQGTDQLSDMRGALGGSRDVWGAAEGRRGRCTL